MFPTFSAMKFVADLHLHSKYSRAVSQAMILSKMAEWARYKGINVLATGDFTHPFWFGVLEKELEEAGNGLYKIKSQISKIKTDENDKEVYFLLSCEVSSIYSQGGKVRRIHNLFFFPKLESVEKFNKELLKRGANLRSDGRPIVGISSRDLVEIALFADKKALVVPAHIWTPWFSLFGAFSGFDSIAECFGDMEKFIFGVETGLSSDPAMNWRIRDLEGRSILSFSDAHSLGKMGREATVFEAGEISYESIYRAIADLPADPSSAVAMLRRVETSVKAGSGAFALRSPRQFGESSNASAPAELGVRSRQGGTLGKTSPHAEAPRAKPATPRIAFTIEFYPEEGKYHYTGHRQCNFSLSPSETKKNGDTCPVCKRKLTIGVMHRVEELAKKDNSSQIKLIEGMRWVYQENNSRPPYVSMVPLFEIIAEALSTTPSSKKAMDCYLLLVNNLGSELTVLLKADSGDIAKFAPGEVVEGIERVRGGNIVVVAGYDGQYGVVKIWQEKEDQVKEEQAKAQLNLFA